MAESLFPGHFRQGRTGCSEAQPARAGTHGSSWRTWVQLENLGAAAPTFCNTTQILDAGCLDGRPQVRTRSNPPTATRPRSAKRSPSGAPSNYPSPRIIRSPRARRQRHSAAPPYRRGGAHRRRSCPRLGSDLDTRRRRFARSAGLGRRGLRRRRSVGATRSAGYSLRQERSVCGTALSCVALTSGPDPRRSRRARPW